MDHALQVENTDRYISNLLLHDSERNSIDWEKCVERHPNLIYKKGTSLQVYFRNLIVKINDSPLDSNIKFICIKYLKVKLDTNLNKNGLNLETIDSLLTKNSRFTLRQKFMIVNKVENVIQSMFKWTNFQEIVNQIPQFKYSQGLSKFLQSIDLPQDTQFNNLLSVLQIYLVKIYDSRFTTIFRNPTALEIENILSASDALSDIDMDNLDGDDIQLKLQSHQENIRKLISLWGRDLILTIIFIKGEALKLKGYDRYFFIKIAWEELESCLEEGRVFNKTIFQFKSKSNPDVSKRRLNFHHTLEKLAGNELRRLRNPT